jgi:peptidoglycan/LPS O-acetylase OafA/YrhL
VTEKQLGLNLADSPAGFRKETTNSPSLSYVPALDGLRAVAIVGVLVFHAMPGALRGGFTGVDVFFVLSGYLITSVILHDLQAGRFSISEFYLRRIQRLVPNVVFTILFTVVLTAVVLLPSDAVQVARHGLWTMFNLSNMYIWRNVGGYWGDSAASVPLLHTWSLAVEEQFYLFLPVTLLFLFRRKYSFKLIVPLTIASLLLSIYGTYAHPTATFYLLATRAWEPLVGASLATVLVSARSDGPPRSWKSSRFVSALGWSGLVMIVAGFFLITEANGFPGVIALVPTLGALAVLTAVARGETSVARVLSNSFLVWIGKLSYSIYLWHWPLIVIARQYAYLTDRSQQRWTLVGAAVGVALSVIAYFAVEQPLRHRGPGRRWRLRALAVGFCLCGVTCFILSSQHPVADALGRFDQPTFYGNLYSVASWNRAEIASSKRYADVFFPPEEPHPPQVWLNGGIVHAWGGGNPRVVVLGSSHALMYGQLIDDICKNLGLSVAFLSADQTPVFFFKTVNERFPSVALAESFDSARKKWVSEWHPDAVLVIDRWDRYSRASMYFDHNLHELFVELAPHARRVIVFSQVPALRVGETFNLREYVTWCIRRTGRLPAIWPDAEESFRKSSMAAIEAGARDFPNIRLLRVDPPFYASDGSVRFSAGRSFFYADEDHLTSAGAEVVREICTTALMEATGVGDGPARGAMR